MRNRPLYLPLLFACALFLSEIHGAASSAVTRMQAYSQKYSHSHTVSPLIAFWWTADAQTNVIDYALVSAHTTWVDIGFPPQPVYEMQGIAALGVTDPAGFYVGMFVLSEGSNTTPLLYRPNYSLLPVRVQFLSWHVLADQIRASL